MNSPHNKVAISEKIKAYREKHRISQREFGERIGVSPQAVCKWEHGACYPDITILPRLAKLLDCPIESFFDGVADGPDT